MLRQRTLRSAVATSGIGLHSGTAIRLRLLPAQAGSGVIFRRTDTGPPTDIPAVASSVVDTRLATTLAAGGQQVATVEHLLAALAGLGIDNVRVELDGPEVPIMDGSAAPFVELIRRAGVVELDAPRQYLRIKRAVSIVEGDKKAGFFPFAGFKVAFTIDFNLPVFRSLTAHVEMDFATASFIREVSGARTFGFIHEVEELRSQGLARGGSLDNAVVVDTHRVLNRGGLRSEDEFVKHKVLDALGDLSLLGYPLIGEYRAVKSGHTLNHAAIAALLRTPQAWDLVPGSALSCAPIAHELMPCDGVKKETV